MRSWLDGIFFSNTFIALCAALAVEQTYLQLGVGWQWNWLTLCVATATFAQYNIQRLISLRVIKRETLTPSTIWMARNWKPIALLSFVSIGIAGVALTQLNADLWVPLLVIAGVAGLYAVPIGRFRLREVGMLKLFLIAVIWGLVTVTLPAYQAGPEVWSHQHGLLLLERILFIMALTLPFDTRDILMDAAYDLKTIPSLIGKQSTVVLCMVLLGTVVVVEVVRQVVVIDEWQSLTGITLSALLSGWIILKQQRWEGRYYYLGLLDGMILAQALLVGFFISLA